MQDSLVAGRRMTVRIAAIQAGSAALTALAFLVQGSTSALAALIGGGAAALGTVLMGWRAFRGGVVPAGTALLQLVAGVVLKWSVIVGALLYALTQTALPPLPLLVGMGATLVAFMAGASLRGFKS